MALERPQVITEYLADECAARHVLGPLNCDEFPQVHISRFGVIPKGSHYVRTKDVAQKIAMQRRGALMVKVDVKKAHSNGLIDPDDR